MPAFATWDESARQRGGAVIAWINQTDAPSLEAANSEGVCYAIVREGIRRCRGYTADRGTFVKTFTARDQDGKVLNANVPMDYIDQQNNLTAALKIYQKEASARNAKITELEKKKGNETMVKQLRLEGWRANQRAFGGEGCEKAVGRRLFAEVIDALNKVSTEPLYIGLTFYWDANKETSGHMVG